MNCRRTWLAASALVAGCLIAGSARAQNVPNCNDTTMFPNPIYFIGSSAFETTAGNMAILLAQVAGNDKVTLIYQATSSCDGPNYIKGATVMSGVADVFVPSTANPLIATKASCTLATGQTADLGVSDIFYENCPAIDPPTLDLATGITDVTGPVQSMIFIVPAANKTVTAISAEQAQDIWGCGMSGAVAPFTNETDIQQRNSGSGTQGIIAKAINVPATAFKGNPNPTGTNMVSSMIAAPDQSEAIGFLAADSYDAKRTQFNALAFRAFGQTKAYYADSAFGTFDKRNTRDGHYVVWGPEHFFVTVDPTTKAVNNPKAVKFLGWLNGTLATPAFNYIDVEARSNVVPQCAMKVSRATDGGLLKSYKPATPCGCYFESVATSTAVPPGCIPCGGGADGGTDGGADSGSTTCPTGTTCSNNFCE
jgi:hypothetical protein